MPQDDAEQIIAVLRREAKAGNVQAARELREWLKAQREREQGAETLDTATSYAQLSEAQRIELRARLLGEYVPQLQDYPTLRAPAPTAPLRDGAQEPVQEPVHAPVEALTEVLSSFPEPDR